MSWRSRRVMVLVTVLTLVACGKDAPPIDEPAVERHGGEPDEPVTANVAVDEAAIRTTFDADGATVTIPVEVLSAGVGKTAELEVELTDLDGGNGQLGQATVLLEDGSTDIVVTIPGAEVPATQPQQVSKLIRYRVKAGSEVASGTRSLYYTMGKLGLRMWAPNRLDAGTTTTVRFWVRDLISGSLIEGAEVTVAGQTGTTDLAGQLAMDIPVPVDATELDLTAVAHDGDLETSLTRSIQVVPAGAPKLFVSTDKPLYRPGQTMHIRAMALAAKDLKPIDGEGITLEVLDGKQNKIFKEDADTNGFGIASLTAPLAIQVNTGTYTIKAIMADITHEITVEVSEEKLPKFALEATFDSPYFAPGEPITGVLSAQYFFGKSVVGADVTIEAPGATIDRPSTFSGKTDSEGLMSFTLPGGAAAPGLTLAVTVVDTAGFTVAKAFEAKVATAQLYLQLLPESSIVPEGKPFRAFVEARGPLGAPVDATCKLGEGDDTEGFNTEGGLAVVETSAQQLYVSCTTSDGVQGSASMWVSKAAADESLLLRSDKALYAPGDDMTLTVFGPEAQDVAYVDCIHRGRIVASHTVDLIDGEGAVTLTAGEGKSGTLHFTAYFVSESDGVVSTDRIAYIRQTGAKVAVSTDAESYLPGGEATLTFQVSDEAGNGKPGAIGVTIADEAVFALAGGAGPNDVKRFFLLSDAPEAVHPYALAEEPEALQLAAEAALTQVNLGNEASMAGLTLASLQWEVLSLVEDALYTMRNEVSSDFQDAASSGTLTVNNAAGAVDSLDLYDFWGQRVLLEADIREDYWSAYVRIHMHSYGPDELPDTWDDWQSSISVWFPSDDSNEMASEVPPMSAGGMTADSASSPYPTDPDYGYQSENGGPADEEAEAPKKRDDFPETLYVNPALITDETGEATVTLPLADAITSWRVSMIANTADGLVGGGLGGITVFQEFFVDVDLPRTLTQNDEMALPVGVFNFGEEDQSVEVTITEASWFELNGPAVQTLLVPAGSSAAVPFRVTVRDAGHHELVVTATAGSGSGDQIGRMVRVIPDGQRIDVGVSGPLESVVENTINFPADSIQGGNDALLKLMGGPSAQMVDGVDALLNTPRGCFEPMMNSTWLNALVLDYMGWTDAGSPDLEATAKANLDDGVQQSITFECTGGGFTWFGDPSPAHPILTAFALIMFEDIRVNKNVDEGLVARAVGFLEGEQRGDGSWDTTEHTKNEIIPWDSLRTSCIVTNGLASNGEGDAGRLGSAVAYIDGEMNLLDADTYTLAMCANALLEAAPGEAGTDATIAELLNRAQTDGDQVFWDSDFPGVSNAGGEVVQVETTAIATQAMYKMDTPPQLAEGALKFLAGKKSPDGNFRSTQGTIQAMRAFVAAAKFASGETDVDVVVKAGDDIIYETHIDETNREVVHLVSLADYADSDIDVSVEIEGDGKLYYALASRHYRPWNPAERRVGPNMDVSVSYDPVDMLTTESTTATVTVIGTGDAIGPGDMPMVDVGVPPGFEADLSELDHLVLADPNVARYEIKGDRVWIYLHELSPDNGFEVNITLSPRFPMQISTPPARAWEFFKPEAWSESLPVQLTVTDPA